MVKVTAIRCPRCRSHNLKAEPDYSFYRCVECKHYFSQRSIK